MKSALAVVALVALLVCAVIISAPGSSRAAFPGANGKIAFDSDRFGDEQIFVVASPGGDADQLTNDGRNYSPEWSRDGTRITFVSERDGKNQVYVMDADGDQQMGLTSGTVGASAPAWSADGNKVAFIRLSESDSHYSIWTVDSGGGNSPVELINLPGEDTMPAFSPDGSKIAFAHADPNGDFDIYVANANGTNAAGITNNETSNHWPDWSPDGNKIAFLCTPDQGDAEVCVIDAAGGNEHTVTDNTTSSEYSPAWSPDGTRIAFEGDGPEGSGVYTINASGGDVQAFSVHGDESEPDWQALSSQTPTRTPSPSPTTSPTGTPGSQLVQGDVDCSGAVNIGDFVVLIEFAAEVSDGVMPGDCPDVGAALPAGDLPQFWGDVDCDGDVDARDALAVLGWPELELPHGSCRDIGQALG